MNLRAFAGQPPAFQMIFMVEMWERFGFYTVQGILTLYFIRFLGYSDLQSYETFGAFSALVYGLVVIGGILGDKLLGTKRTIVLGLITLVAGYMALAITDKEHVFLALGLICVGNGIFKANPSSLLSKCYEENDSRLHSGFTLYYMSINLGSMVALVAGPFIASRYGYFYAYFLSAMGLLLGLLNYGMQRSFVSKINTEADKRYISPAQWIFLLLCIVLLTECCAYLLQHVMVAKNLLTIITVLAVFYYFVFMRREHHAASMKMFVAFILMLEAIIFFTLYQQMPTSLNLFAVNNVDPHFLGFIIDPQSYQALNPIWIVAMSPVLAFCYNLLSAKGIRITVPHKFALGMTLAGLSFLLLFFARYFATESGVVSSSWLITSYWFQSVGELLVSALGVAMVAELVPPRIVGFVMGMWFLTTSVSGFVGAKVASYTALPAHIKPGMESLLIYTQVFAYIGLVTLFLALCMWLLAPALNRFIHPNKSLKTVDTDHKAILGVTEEALAGMKVAE